jgi:hypothetical protein
MVPARVRQSNGRTATAKTTTANATTNVHAAANATGDIYFIGSAATTTTEAGGWKCIPSTTSDAAGFSTASAATVWGSSFATTKLSAGVWNFFSATTAGGIQRSPAGSRNAKYGGGSLCRFGCDTDKQYE